MRAIKILFILGVFLITSNSFAYDEEWGIFQFRKKLEGDNQIFAEYVRRDYSKLFDQRNFDMIRLSWGGRVGQWGYLVGASYLDFERGNDERRLHQFFTYNTRFENAAAIFVRLGLEQRNFITDENLYWRQRTRVQVNFLPQYVFGVAAYNEAFYAFNGYKKFAVGLNENRHGWGLRYNQGPFDVYLYHVFAELTTLKSKTQPQWLQLQTVYTF